MCARSPSFSITRWKNPTFYDPLAVACDGSLSMRLKPSNVFATPFENFERIFSSIHGALSHVCKKLI